MAEPEMLKLYRALVAKIAALPRPPRVREGLVQADGQVLFPGDTAPLPLVHDGLPGDWITALHTDQRVHPLARPGSTAIVIDGTAYRSAGVFASLPAYSLTAAAPAYYATIEVPAPFAPPAGWGFVPHVVRTVRYPSVAVGNPRANPLQIRYVQHGSASIDASLVIGWRLLPV